MSHALSFLGRALPWPLRCLMGAIAAVLLLDLAIHQGPSAVLWVAHGIAWGWDHTWQALAQWGQTGRNFWYPLGLVTLTSACLVAQRRQRRRLGPWGITACLVVIALAGLIVLGAVLPSAVGFTGTPGENALRAFKNALILGVVLFIIAALLLVAREYE